MMVNLLLRGIKNIYNFKNIVKIINNIILTDEIFFNNVRTH